MITEKKFYNNFLLGLDKNSIKYLILKNYENFPNKNISNDIDMLTKKKEIKKIINLIKKLKNIKIIKLFYKSNGVAVYIYGIKRVNGSNSLQIDLLWGLNWKGISYLDTNEMLNNRKKITKNKINFYVPNKYNNQNFIILNQLLKYKKIDINYYKKIKAFINQHKRESLDNISTIVGTSNAKIIISNISNNINYLNFFIRIRCYLYLLLKTNIFLYIKNLYKFLVFDYFKNILIKNKLIIIFLGPDGSGKTTQINKIIADFTGIFSEIKVRHLKQKIWFFQKRIKQRGVVTNPHGLKNRSLIVSCAKILLWSFGEIVFNIFDKPKHPQLVLMDRYFYDISIDPRRYRYGGYKFLLNFLNVLLPRPKLIIILYSKSSILFKRKQEIEINKLKKIIKLYQNFKLSNLPIIKINTNKKVYKISNIIKKNILKTIK